MDGPGTRERAVAFVIFDGFQSLDLAGPYEVFRHAGESAASYSCRVIARRAGPVRASSGLSVLADHGIADTDPAGFDTLIVAGGSGVDQARGDGDLVRWIAAAGTGARRTASVCSGVFLLAA